MSVLLKPRWLIGHLLIAAMSVLMIGLGFWQLDRLDQRKAQNDDVRAALVAEPIRVDGIGQLPDGLTEYSPVEITGTYDPTQTVYRRYPIRNGIQGYEVLTPLRVGGGTMIVNRGFVPIDEGRFRAQAEVSSPVQTTVRGYIRNYKTGGSVGANEGLPPIPTVTDVDAAQLRGLVGNQELCKYWVQLSTPTSEQGPLPLELPEINEGSHLAYALQWFGFTVVIVIGWIVLCRKTLISAREEHRDPASDIS